MFDGVGYEVVEHVPQQFAGDDKLLDGGLVADPDLAARELLRLRANVLQQPADVDHAVLGLMALHLLDLPNVLDQPVAGLDDVHRLGEILLVLLLDVHLLQRKFQVAFDGGVHIADVMGQQVDVQLGLLLRLDGIVLQLPLPGDVLNDLHAPDDLAIGVADGSGRRYNGPPGPIQALDVDHSPHHGVAGFHGPGKGPFPRSHRHAGVGPPSSRLSEIADRFVV